MSPAEHMETIARNRQLSWAARGLALYLVGNRGRIEVQALVDETRAAYGRSSGRDAVYGLLKELSEAGFIRRIQERDSSGRLGPVYYELTLNRAAEEVAL